jgi:uncharacterized surface protein with fasciclin (FAS1) repeats
MLRFLSSSFLVATCYGQINNAGTISNDDRLSKFVQLLDRVAISPSSGKTIFAPTTDAWQVFREEDVDLWNKYASQAEFYVQLRELLMWHFVTEGSFTFDEIFDGSRGHLENSMGNITIDQTFQKIDNVPASAFLEANVTTSDGIIHILDRVIVPPYLGQNLIEQMLDDRNAKFAFSTMANLALWAGLEDEINGIYEHGITLLVPPNRRFNRAEIDVPNLLTAEMRSYTRDLVLCHMIKDIYHEAAVFATHKEEDTQQSLVVSELGTHMWITTTEDRLRFQSTEVIVFDQAAKNG